MGRRSGRPRRRDAPLRSACHPRSSTTCPPWWSGWTSRSRCPRLSASSASPRPRPRAAARCCSPATAVTSSSPGIRIATPHVDHQWDAIDARRLSRLRSQRAQAVAGPAAWRPPSLADPRRPPPARATLSSRRGRDLAFNARRMLVSDADKRALYAPAWRRPRARREHARLALRHPARRGRRPARALAGPRRAHLPARRDAGQGRPRGDGGRGRGAPAAPGPPPRRARGEPARLAQAPRRRDQVDPGSVSASATCRSIRPVQAQGAASRCRCPAGSPTSGATCWATRSAPAPSPAPACSGRPPSTASSRTTRPSPTSPPRTSCSRSSASSSGTTACIARACGIAVTGLSIVVLSYDRPAALRALLREPGRPGHRRSRRSSCSSATTRPARTWAGRASRPRAACCGRCPT